MHCFHSGEVVVDSGENLSSENFTLLMKLTVKFSISGNVLLG